MISRIDHGPVANWWWSIDRFIFVACCLLIGLGVLFSCTASPSVAKRINITDGFHFVKLHVQYAVPAGLVMIFVSCFTLRDIWRICLILFVLSVVLLCFTLFTGLEIKGSKRWISLVGFTIQPSEFMKPALMVTLAWLLAAAQNQSVTSSARYYIFAVALYVICAALLILEPDIGQTLLISMTGYAFLILSGISWILLLFLSGVAIVGVLSFYVLFDHVSERVNAFLMGIGDTFQVDAGREAIIHGSWFGKGPGEGTVKYIIPDSHTDFILSVAAEEYGIVPCILIISLFAFIVIRALFLAMKQHTDFTRFSISGLVILFGFQSIINMAVNLHLMPPKGITLPFISYGGSSLIAVAFSMGCLLSLTRKRPEMYISAALNNVKIL
ncbi:MAG: cell division protein FtsW [Candidatus Tokpelaia sp. JSC085]|nr:MAG: cell division protein FtsW [Candidatus Tokpelaia sp. JSC085]